MFFSVFRDLQLSTKLNSILAIVLVSAIAISGFTLSKILENKIEQEVEARASLIIETMNSIRSYTNSNVKPELASRLANEAYFIPETVPAYSAREVFERLRQQPEYYNFLYKEATINPTNPRDKANEFEAEIVQQFRQNRELKEKTGFRTDGINKFYYSGSLIDEVHTINN